MRPGGSHSKYQSRRRSCGDSCSGQGPARRGWRAPPGTPSSRAAALCPALSACCPARAQGSPCARTQVSAALPLLPQRVWAGGQRLTAGQFFEASLISETMRGWEEGETEVADDFTPPSKRAWGPEGSLRRDAVPLTPPTQGSPTFT